MHLQIKWIELINDCSFLEFLQINEGVQMIFMTLQKGTVAKRLDQGIRANITEAY